MRQDKFYFKTEADSFFLRHNQIYENLKKNEVRKNKIEIYKLLKRKSKF